MNKVRGRTKSENRERWYALAAVLFSLIMGAALGFFLSIRYAGFWQFARLQRFLILFFFSMACSVLFFLLLVVFLKIYKRFDVRIGVAIYALTAVAFGILWLLKLQPKFINKVPFIWLNGIGRAVEKQISGMLFVFALPWIAIFCAGVFICMLVWLSKRVKRDVLKKQYNALFCAAFLLVCILPVAKSGDLSAIDRKFWMRNELLELYSNTRYQLGDKVIRVAIIEGNWVMLANPVSIKDYQNTDPFTEKELQTLHKKLVGVKNYLNKKGIIFLVAIVPNKNTIYPEYLQEVMPVIGEKSRLDQFINYMADHNEVRIADMRDEMLEYRSEKEIYYPTDSHWNPFGAWVGYRVILDALKEDFPGLTPHGLDEYEIINQEIRIGDAALRLANISIPERFFSINLIGKEDYLQRFFYEKGVTYSPYLTITQNTDDTLPKMMMYHDSFGPELVPLLADHFSNASYLWAREINGNVRFDISYVDVAKPDVVVFEFTERFIPRLFSLPDL